MLGQLPENPELLLPEGEVFADTLVKERHLSIYASFFECPYCARVWDRGGRKEGFVKSAANNHVYACFQLRLTAHGYFASSFVEGRRKALSFGKLLEHKRGPIVIRSLKAALLKARRTGRI